MRILSPHNAHRRAELRLYPPHTLLVPCAYTIKYRNSVHEPSLRSIHLPYRPPHTPPTRPEHPGPSYITSGWLKPPFGRILALPKPHENPGKIQFIVKRSNPDTHKGPEALKKSQIDATWAPHLRYAHYGET